MNTPTGSKTSLNSILKKIERPEVSNNLTAALECRPMGDYCFDPQVGMYKREDIYKDVDIKESFIYDDGVGSATSLDRELVNCDKDNFFDLYCGKSKRQNSIKTKIEIWIDTSSTLRQVDSDVFNATCHREKFLKLMDTKCSFGSEMKVYTFNEHKKELGNMRSACASSGLNKIENLIRDIKSSKANHLVIITDIFELNEKFTNFIKASKVGVIKGDKGDFVASSLVAQAHRLSRLCK